MKIWIVTNNDCPGGGYESAWRTEEAAEAERDRLNAQRGRIHYYAEEDELND